MEARASQRKHWRDAPVRFDMGIRVSPNRSGCFVADVRLNGVLHQLASALKRQLFFDMSLVSFDGFYAEVQFLGNLAGAAAFTDQAEYLELTIGKGGEAGVISAGAPLMYW